MPGHDKSLIVGFDQDHLEEFICGICQDVLNKPVVTQCCRQSYCRQSITEWLTDQNTCPNDRSSLTPEGLGEVPRLVLNLMNKMMFKCQSIEKGCDALYNIEKYQEHWDTCKYRFCDKCACKDPPHDHECLVHLITENLKFKEELSNLKIKSVNQKNELEKCSQKIKNLTANEKLSIAGKIDLENQLKNLREKLELNSKIESDLRKENDKLKNKLDKITKIERPNLIAAIGVAKSIDGVLNIKNGTIPIKLCHSMRNICNCVLHQSTNFGGLILVREIANKIKELPEDFRTNKKWNVLAFVEEMATYNGDINIVHIEFEKLIIQISC